MDELQRAKSALDQIEALLKKHCHAGVDPVALARIQSLTMELRGGDTYISEKAGQLRELASMYYSARRHLKYPGGTSSLYAAIAYDLPSRIGDQIEHIERMREKGAAN